MPDSPHPRTGRVRPRQAHNAYTYNPACACLICANGGTIPQDHPEAGHAFAYGLEHVPPVSLAPWRQAA